MKTIDPESSVKILEEKLAVFKGNFTLSDAAAATGLAIDEARTVLDKLMAIYVCRLRLTDNGDLIYSFGTKPLRRGEKTPEEILSTWLRKVFALIFIAWIAIVVSYFFLGSCFLYLLAVLMIAKLARRNNRKNSFDFFFSIFPSQDDKNPVQIPLSGKKTAMKSFVMSVYDFVFGPERVSRDPLANEKEVAAYLRRQNGIVTVSELIALTGFKRENAELLLSDCIVRFQGDAMVSENGIVYGRFDNLTRSSNESADGKIEFYLDEYEIEKQLTGNSSGHNTLIFYMILSNLIGGAYVVFGDPMSKIVDRSGVNLIVYGWLPLIFSILIYAIPIVRKFFIVKRRKFRKIDNIYRRVMRVIFESKEKSASMEAILAVTVFEEAQVEIALKALMRDFEGEIKLSEDGKPLYAFPRIAEEYEEAQKLRSGRTKEKNLGEVIIDSQN